MLSERHFTHLQSLNSDLMRACTVKCLACATKVDFFFDTDFLDLVREPLTSVLQPWEGPAVFTLSPDPLLVYRRVFEKHLAWTKRTYIYTSGRCFLCGAKNGAPGVRVVDP